MCEWLDIIFSSVIIVLHDSFVFLGKDYVNHGFARYVFR